MCTYMRMRGEGESAEYVTHYAEEDNITCSYAREARTRRPVQCRLSARNVRATARVCRARTRSLSDLPPRCLRVPLASNSYATRNLPRKHKRLLAQKRLRPAESGEGSAPGPGNQRAMEKMGGTDEDEVPAAGKAGAGSGAPAKDRWVAARSSGGGQDRGGGGAGSCFLRRREPPLMLNSAIEVDRMKSLNAEAPT
jgi:hypothetical protein